jgi:hypothetical protein
MLDRSWPPSKRLFPHDRRPDATTARRALVLIARQRLAVEQPWNKQWIIVVNHGEPRHPKSAV